MAIKAHLDQAVAAPATSLERQRSSPRRALWLETSGFFADAGPDGVEANVTIHNISAAGLLLETGLTLAEGEQLALDLPEAGPVIATIVWHSERLYGCAFTEPLAQSALAAAQLQGFSPAAPNSSSRPNGPRTPASASAGSGEGLGPRLARLRREAGLTLADVAATLKVSKPTVWAWEKGKARPLPERLDAIAAALGVDADLLSSAPPAREIDTLIAECRARIAAACDTVPEAVKIMIEL